MSNHDKIQRSLLPIPDRSHVGLVTYDAKDPDTKFPPIEPLRPPKGAPNVLIVLLDDVGFASSSTFGGPCQTPNFEKLAVKGLKYNRSTTVSTPRRCAPRRARRYSPVGSTGCKSTSAKMTSITSSVPKSGCVRPCGGNSLIDEYRARKGD